MKELSMKEFAALCKTDPALFQQVLSMPGTVSLDRLLGLAARNGYRILPERSRSALWAWSRNRCSTTSSP